MRGRVFKRYSSWKFVVDVGRDAKGRRQQVQRSGFATKREAERALRELLQAVDSGRYVERSRVSVAEFLREAWLPTVRRDLRETTWVGYRAELELNVIPRLGGIPLQQLNAVHLNRLYGYLLTEGRKDGKGGLSRKSVRYVHTIVRKALADAMRWGLLERNVADLADAPRLTGTSARHIRAWTPEQLRSFLDHVAGDRLYAAWLLAATTGMRRGEVLGLPWQDVDLDVQRLAVRQTLVMVKSAARYSEPKTRRSRRTIDLDDVTVSALRDWREFQDKERQAWGAAWKNLGLVFTREDGSAIYPDGWTGTFERHVRQAGLPRIRLHDLRHTHATLMLKGGVNPKVVSERLGHHSAAFTLDVYSHVIPGMQADAARRVSHLIFPTAEDDGDADV